ncbi:MAG: 50S ribosomal protein L32 [Planctomyces sp.]|nr:50S ribosomal protein L32 [Planctomyces sp.]MBA4039156.1 50S ribosomal protein L32 [Planctomyces sp.]MBA4119560.1 50S ribosomal protein L32 [Isosphaera sp.]
MLPPQRVSYGRTRRRRAHHALTEITGTQCPITFVPKQHHRAAESGYVRPGLRIRVPKLGIGVEERGS